MGLKRLPWDSYIGRGGIGGDTSHNALKWVASMYNSFDHFPYLYFSVEKFLNCCKMHLFHESEHHVHIAYRVRTATCFY